MERKRLLVRLEDDLWDYIAKAAKDEYTTKTEIIKTMIIARKKGTLTIRRVK